MEYRWIFTKYMFTWVSMLFKSVKNGTINDDACNNVSLCHTNLVALHSLMTPWYNNFGSVLADTLLFVRRDMLDDIIVRCTCVMYFYPSEEHLYLWYIYIYLSSQNAQKCLGHLTLCSNEVHKIRRQHQFVVKICWWRRISDCQSRQPIQSSVAGSRAGAGLLAAEGVLEAGWGMGGGVTVRTSTTGHMMDSRAEQCHSYTWPGPPHRRGEGCSGEGAAAAGVLVSLYCDVRWLTAPAGPRSWRGRGAALRPQFLPHGRGKCRGSGAGRGCSLSGRGGGVRAGGRGWCRQSVSCVSERCHLSP